MSTISTSPEGSERASPTPSSPATSISSDGKLSNPPWIIHYLLSAPIRWELPLRIMFSFNRGRDLPTLRDCHKWWHYEEQGKYLSKFFSSLKQIQGESGSQESDAQASNHPSDRYMDLGNDVLFDEVLKKYKNAIPSHNSNEFEGTPGIPLKLVKTICLDQTFRLRYEEANFDYALLAIDYLRDLEYTRRSKLRKAATNLGIKESDWMEKLSGDPDALKWIEETEKAELEIEQLYASLFIDLRVWTMLHVLKSDVFYKPNVLAMLNTLFPPGDQDLPNERIIPKVMHQQRATFFQYVMAVEKASNGRAVVLEFEKKMLMRENRHNYPAVRWRLEEYMSLAERMITKADLVYGIDFFRPKKHDGFGDKLGMSMSSIKQSSTLKSMVSMTSMKLRLTGKASQKNQKSATFSDEDDEVASLYTPYEAALHDNHADSSSRQSTEPEEIRAVAERVRSFSRPTEFVLPNSQAAKHAEFTKLRAVSTLPPPELSVASPSTAMFVPPPLKIQKMKKLEAEDKKSPFMGMWGKSKENINDLQDTKRKASWGSLSLKTSDLQVKKSIPESSMNADPATGKPKLVKAATFGSVEEFTPDSKKSEPDLTKKPSMSSLKRTKQSKTSPASSNKSATSIVPDASSTAGPVFNELYDASPPRKEASEEQKRNDDLSLVNRMEQSVDTEKNKMSDDKPANQKNTSPTVTSEAEKYESNLAQDSIPTALKRRRTKDSTASSDNSSASMIAHPGAGGQNLEKSPKRTGRYRDLQEYINSGPDKEQDRVTNGRRNLPTPEKQSNQELTRENTTPPSAARADPPIPDVSVFEMDNVETPKKKLDKVRRQKTTPNSSPRKSEEETKRPSTSDSSRKKFFQPRLPRKVSFSSPSKARASLEEVRPSTSGSPFRRRPPPISTAQPAKPILKKPSNDNTGIGGYLKSLGRNWTGHMVVQPSNVHTPPLQLTPNPFLPNDGGKFLEQEWQPAEFAAESIEKEGGKIKRSPSLSSIRGALRKAKSMTDIVHRTKSDSLGIIDSSKSVTNSDLVEINNDNSQSTNMEAVSATPSTPEIKPRKLQKKASNVTLKSKSSTKFNISDPAPIDDIVVSLGLVSSLSDVKAQNINTKVSSDDLEVTKRSSRTQNNEVKIPLAPPRPQTAPELFEKSSQFGTWPQGVDEARLENQPWKYRHNYGKRDLHRQQMRWAAWLQKEKKPPNLVETLEEKFKDVVAGPKSFKEWSKEEDTRLARPLPPHVPRNSDQPVPRIGTYEVRDWEDEKWKDWEVVGGRFGEKFSPWVEKVHRSQRESDSGVILHLPYETGEETISLKNATPEQWNKILAERKARLNGWKTNKENRVVRLVQPDYSIFNPEDDEIYVYPEKELEIDDAASVKTAINLQPQFIFAPRVSKKRGMTKSKKKTPLKIEKDQSKRLADVFPLSRTETQEFREVNEKESMEVQVPFMLTVDNDYERIILPVDDWEDIQEEKKQKKKDDLRKVKSFADLRNNRVFSSRNPFSRKASMASMINPEAQASDVSFKPSQSSVSVSNYNTPTQNNTPDFSPYRSAVRNASFSTHSVYTSTASLRRPSNPTFGSPSGLIDSSLNSSFNTPADASVSSFQTPAPNSGFKPSPSVATFMSRSRKASAVSFGTFRSRNTSIGSNAVPYNKYTPTLTKQSSTFNLKAFGLKKREKRRSIIVEKRLSDRAVFRGIVAQGPRRRRGVLFGRRENVGPEEVYISTALSDRMRRKVFGDKEKRVSWKSKERVRRQEMRKAGANTRIWEDSSESSEDDIVED